MLKIKEVRIQLDITQESMGKLMGMKQQAIARIETGVRDETKQQKAQLRSLLALHKAGLL